MVDHFHPFRVSIFQRLTDDALALRVDGQFWGEHPDGENEMPSRGDEFHVLHHHFPMSAPYAGLVVGTSAPCWVVRFGMPECVWAERIGRMAACGAGQRRASSPPPQIDEEHVIASL